MIKPWSLLPRSLPPAFLPKVTLNILGTVQLHPLVLVPFETAVESLETVVVGVAVATEALVDVVERVVKPGVILKTPS